MAFRGVSSSKADAELHAPDAFTDVGIWLQRCFAGQSPDKLRSTKRCLTLKPSPREFLYGYYITFL